MNARVSQLRGTPARFVVPGDDVRWCAALAEALSVCCASPSPTRQAEVRALVNAPPPVLFPTAWDDLVQAARAWLVVIAGVDPAPPFAGIRLIEKALRDMPVPVPAWATRFQ